MPQILNLTLLAHDSQEELLFLPRVTVGKPAIHEKMLRQIAAKFDWCLSTISAAIFKNESEDGRVRYNTQFDRSYKDGDEWKHTRSFGRDDLLLLAKVADQVHTWIYEQQQSAAAEPDEPSPN